MARRSSIALQFRAEAYDHPDGTVDGGTVMTWIDKAAYAAAASWSGTNVVASYVGNMHFAHAVPVETRVVVQARVVHTGTSAVHIQARVILPDFPAAESAPATAMTPVITPEMAAAAAAAPEESAPAPLVCTECVMVYVSVDEQGRSQPVRSWEPVTPTQIERDRVARARSTMRREVEAVLAQDEYPEDTTAECVTLRFIAHPKDAAAGDTLHGGAMMRWIDEAADVCASRWCQRSVLAVFAGGVRFYTPVHAGDLVEVEAQLMHTGRHSMHISVRARAGDRRSRELELVAHGLSVMVATGPDGKALEVPAWTPVTDADRALEQRSMELVALRNRSAHEWMGR